MPAPGSYASGWIWDLADSARAHLPTLELERLTNGTVLLCHDNAVYQVLVDPPAAPNVTASLLANQLALASGVATLDRGSAGDNALHLLTHDGRNLQLFPLTQRNDFGGSGIFTSADPHVKRLITPQELAQARVLSYRNFTPGRRFFYLTVLYHDADYLLLTYYATASLGSQRFVQGLDVRTAAVRFTTPLPADGTVPNLALRDADGFVVGRNRTTYTLSPTGQLGPAVTRD